MRTFFRWNVGFVFGLTIAASTSFASSPIPCRENVSGVWMPKVVEYSPTLNACVFKGTTQLAQDIYNGMTIKCYNITDKDGIENKMFIGECGVISPCLKPENASDYTTVYQCLNYYDLPYTERVTINYPDLKAKISANNLAKLGVSSLSLAGSLISKTDFKGPDAVNPKKDCKSSDAGFDMSGINFTGANIYDLRVGTDFAGLNNTQKKDAKKKYTGVNAAGVSFSKAVNFEAVKFLSKVNLSGADFSNIPEIVGVTFDDYCGESVSKINLTNAKFMNSVFEEGVTSRISNAIFGNTDFSYAEVNSMNIDSSNGPSSGNSVIMNGTRYLDGYINKSTLTSSNFDNAVFFFVEFFKVNISNSQAINTRFIFSNSDGDSTAKFTFNDATANGTIFYADKKKDMAKVEGTNFKGVQVVSSSMEGTSFKGTDFSTDAGIKTHFCDAMAKSAKFNKEGSKKSNLDGVVFSRGMDPSKQTDIRKIDADMAVMTGQRFVDVTAKDAKLPGTVTASSQNAASNVPTVPKTLAESEAESYRNSCESKKLCAGISDCPNLCIVNPLATGCPSYQPQ